ncbi:MAG: hypothetical protein RL219_1130 [Actinomycetota bacterium]
MSERRDSGTTVVEYVVVIPVVFTLVLAGVQAAVYFHAANLASNAASRGAIEASHRNATVADGALESARAASESGAVVMRAVVRGTAVMEATVQVRVARVVPFFPSSVTRTVRVPKERYIPEVAR